MADAETVSASRLGQVPSNEMRDCISCTGSFSLDSGIECINSHYLCGECMSVYVRTACRPGGQFVEAFQNEGGGTVSERGELPCSCFKRVYSAYDPARCDVAALPDVEVF